MQFSWKKGTGLSSRDMAASLKRLKPYRARLTDVAQKSDYADDESSIQLPFDRTLLREVEARARRMGSAVQDVVVVGIGGSSLGAQAVYEALAPTRTIKRMHFLDTVSPVKMREVTEQLLAHKNEHAYVVCVISKSGTTTETVANAMALEAALKRKHPRCLERFVAITEEGSRLWERAKNTGIPVLVMPASVGGRYSVMSAVGLFPLALAGVDVRALVRGAKKAVQENVQNGAGNISQTSAAITHHFWKRGRTIRDTFMFNPELEALGKWERQLVAESLGKRQNLNGKEVRAGITPTVSVGSTDLHSMAQLYVGGPLDKISCMVYAPWNPDVRMPARSSFDGLVDDMTSASFNDMMNAIRLGAEAAYRRNDHPYTEIAFERLSEMELGYYFQFRMLETMYLGKLMRVNAFDQPAVEEYKSVTRRLLGKQ